MWVRRAEGNEVGDVRRTPLRYDLMHEDCEFELDAVLHRMFNQSVNHLFVLSSTQKQVNTQYSVEQDRTQRHEALTGARN